MYVCVHAFVYVCMYVTYVAREISNWAICLYIVRRDANVQLRWRPNRGMNPHALFGPRVVFVGKRLTSCKAVYSVEHVVLTE